MLFKVQLLENDDQFGPKNDFQAAQTISISDRPALTAYNARRSKTKARIEAYICLKCNFGAAFAPLTACAEFFELTAILHRHISSSKAAVAQWIEYWPPKPRVVGSIPASRTRFSYINQQIMSSGT
jgi:hypothetical protein